MLWFSERNHRARLKHNTEFVTEKFWFSFDKVSISSMKIIPRVYTGSIKCLWKRSCWLGKYFSCCWLGRCCCGEYTFALIQQPASFCLSVWHWRLLAPHCRWALSLFCDSWLVSSARDDFAHDVFVLHGEVEAFALAALACVALFSHRQVLFTLLQRRLCRVHSWDFGVFSLIPFIAGRYCFKQIASKSRTKLRVDENQSQHKTIPGMGYRREPFPPLYKESGEEIQRG